MLKTGYMSIVVQWISWYKRDKARGLSLRTAIALALDHIEQSRNSDFIIFSDSLSVLQSLHNRRIENPLLLGVLLKLNG